MDNEEKAALYEKLVLERIEEDEFGGFAVPRNALQEYHDAIGLGDKEYCHLEFVLPEANEGLYNFMIDGNADCKFAIQVVRMDYYDPYSGKSQQLRMNDLLLATALRDFCGERTVFEGIIELDNTCGFTLQAMLSERIGVEYYLRFIDEGCENYGLPIVDAEMSSAWRVWDDGEYIHCTRSAIFVYGGAW